MGICGQIVPCFLVEFWSTFGQLCMYDLFLSCFLRLVFILAELYMYDLFRNVLLSSEGWHCDCECTIVLVARLAETNEPLPEFTIIAMFNERP